MITLPRKLSLLVVLVLAAVLALVPAGGASAAAGDGSPSDPNLRYFGRWDTRTSTAYKSEWAGAYVALGFTGTTVKLRQRNTIDLFASIDGGPFVSYPGVSGTVNLTPRPLASGTHSLRVSYRPVAGSYRGDAVFQGVILDPGARTVVPSVPSKIIEFVGDSITVGQRSSLQTLTAYPWLVGERLKAGHTQIAVGGACLYPSADGCLGVRDRFLKTGLDASTPDWNFSRYQASTVVINLGTNDAGHSVSGANFQAAYVTLLKRVRAKYPAADIIALQTFRKRYINETRQAVAAVGDAKIRFVATDGWINEATDTVDNVHPNDAGHRKIADRLAPIIAGSTIAAADQAASTDQTASTDCAAKPTVKAVAAGPKIWLAGDSTMANGSSTCPVGWGRQFDPLFNDQVTVVNRAVGGRSIQTWLYEGNVTGTKDSSGECIVNPKTYHQRWLDMLNSSTGMQAGDYLFIQFGINDGDPNCPRHVGTARYQSLLTMMVNAAKSRGARPVLLTPVSAIKCSGSTAVGTRGFLSQTFAAGSATGTAVIDLHKLSYTLYNTLKLCPNNGDYSSGAVGAFFCNDHTHFEAAGADKIARVVAQAIRDQHFALASYLK
ncbi:GDSL-type esterase/lipase family protein [Kribbella sp. NPDC023855]|uniref:GDSL-type esterase/lipase family protein n=1 Tax=Kribbella sp. NPDC023855 TaxID=3154698 RepID=UPI0033EDC320